MTECPDSVKDYPKAILTPNVVEFQRLYHKLVSIAMRGERERV